VLKTLPDTRERTQQELTLQLAPGSPLLMIKGTTAQEVERAYTRALELCHQVGDGPQRFTAMVGLWRFYLNQARLRKAHELGEQCFSLAQRLQNPILLQEAHLMLGSTLLYLGELVTARVHLEEGIALYDPRQSRARAFTSGIDTGVGCLSRAAWTLWLLGYPDHAMTRVHEALTLARQSSHIYSLAFALHYTAMIRLYRREAQLGHELAEATIVLSHEHAFIECLAGGMFMQGWALSEQGWAEEGIVQLLQAQNTWRTLGTELGQAHVFVRLAEAYGNNGQAEEGLQALARALAGVHKNAERYYEAELYRLKGQLLLQRTIESDDTCAIPLETSTEAKAEYGGEKHASLLRTEAEICFRQALDVSRHQGAKSLELRAAMSLCRLWQQQGKRAEACQMLAEIYGWFTEGFDTPDLQEAKALLEELTGTGCKPRR
jgi:predicted ATPase